MLFQENIPLSQYSNYKIGGPARYFCIAKNSDEVLTATAEAKKRGLEIFILGGGTNLVFSDDGFDGLVLKPELNGIKREGNAVRVGAGTSMAELLNYSITQSLSGFEWAGGLPGTVGGAIRGNAGAFGGETKDNVKEVVSIDIAHENPQPTVRDNRACQFGYRTSIFKKRDNFGEVRPPWGGRTSKYWADPAEIILEAVFDLRPGKQEEIKKAIEEKIKYRNDRHPMEYPNVGSIFKNTPVEAAPDWVREKFAAKIKPDPFPVIPTAVLISGTDLKGIKKGGAMISPKHPNFIVNVGGATAKDARYLADLVKSTIKEKFGVELEEEVIFL